MKIVTPLRFVATLLLSAFLWNTAHALPAFARQTGQSCVACHAGGQFPELTPYGRLFKLTGYTQGDKGNPLAAMVIASRTKTQNNIADDGSGAISAADSQAVFEVASLFAAGKVTDHIGGWAQYTYTHYDHQDSSGNWQSRIGADNTDFRYTDHLVDSSNDLIWGLSLHNNPTMQDVWNSTPAWGYPYASSTLGAFSNKPAAQPIIEGGLAQQVAGLGGYVFWDKRFYAELTSYQTAKGPWAFLSLGNRTGDPYHPLIYLDGSNPYWRLAYNYEWGPQNIMVGAFGFNAKTLPLDAMNNPLFGMGTTQYKDMGMDAQYQYLLSPHTFTAQARYVKENINDATGQTYTDGAAYLNMFKTKASYVYRAKYGASLAYNNIMGSPDSGAYASSATNMPNTTFWTPEIFWLPYENVRVGLQFNYFTQYAGSKYNYDGNGRNAADNNTTYLYLWAAF